MHGKGQIILKKFEFPEFIKTDIDDDIQIDVQFE